MRQWRAALSKKDFDAWAYNMVYPQAAGCLPLLGVTSFAVEDIKFAYNAWSLLRLSLFFGVEKPKVLSGLHTTRPSMDIAFGGNRLFFMNARVDGTLDAARTKIALTPCHPRAQSIQTFDWEAALRNSRHTAKGEQSQGIELVLGMENGLSPHVVDACDHCVFIPQYGSIGSLSMISALAIVAQAAHTAYYCGWKPTLPTTVPAVGHMPRSNAHQAKGVGRPHEANLLSLSNDEVKHLLALRRKRYSLQLGALLYNELADRNISAVMRNANAFNAEQVIVLNRRKFNRRGAVGTQHLTNIFFADSADDAACQTLLEGYAVWLLYPYYPYLLIYGEDGESRGVGQTFLRPEHPDLVDWCHTGHYLTAVHPLIRQFPHLANTEVFLDDPRSVQTAVQNVKAKGLKGIMIAVPEEGASPHPSLANASSAVLYAHHPQRLASVVQRGLNPALSTAIAFERLRSTIDALPTAQSKDGVLCERHQPQVGEGHT